MTYTEADVINFCELIGPAVVSECGRRGYGNAQVWTCIAQGIHESAAGKSPLMKNANAFFGIKATSAWVKKAKYGGLVYNSKTKECYDGSTYTSITACFRAYKTIDDCVSDYFDLMEISRYNQSLIQDSVSDCITMIQRGGYATGLNYAEHVTHIYARYCRHIIKYFVDVPEHWIASPTLKLGDTGNEVRILQNNLTLAGYPLYIDGSFGAKTEAALKSFQEAHKAGTIWDGIYGPKSYRAMCECLNAV